MKRIIFIFAVITAFAFTASAQKFALVDMEYIMKAIPDYEKANDQLSQLSVKWQKEVETMFVEVQTLYKNYQTEEVFLSDDMKRKRQDQIIEKEKEANELKKKYFGTEGELYKKRESMIKPIQEDIYNAIQALSNDKGYQMIIDKSSNMSLIFSVPKLDVSDEVLAKMGINR